MLKVCLFQQQQNKIKQKFQSLSEDISLETQATLTNASLNVRVDNSSESDRSKSQQEEEQERNKLNESSSVVTSKFRKISTTTKNAQKMSGDSILPEAKQVLLILKQAKKLVKYSKLVSTFE